MPCSDRHVAMEVGQHDVASMVQRFAVEHYSPSAVFVAPEYAARGIVKLVLRLGDATKVCKAVIRAVTVDVIDLLGLFAVEKKPCEPVSKVRAPLMRDANVSVAQFETAGAKSAALDSFDSADDSALGVISEVVANGIRNNFRIHSVLPHVVARGSVAPTTDAPILSQNLRQSGRNDEDPKGHPSSSTTDTPFEERKHG